MNNEDATTQLANGKEIKVVNRVFALIQDSNGQLRTFSGDTYIRAEDGSLRSQMIKPAPKRDRAKLRRRAKKNGK